jgi:glycosyltransferase involved in cell wall biosynthesis
VKVLYITYDGLSDPLGRSQVLPYLQGCAAKGHEITIVSCDKPDRYRQSGDEIRTICRNSKMEWHPLTYHKSPPVLSSVYDSAMLTRQALSLHRRAKFDLVHCRSHLPAIAGLKLKTRTGLPLLFDMRSFWPEERVEGGLWNLRHPLYRAVYNYFKRLESRVLRSADHIVTLTMAGKQSLLGRSELEGRGTDVSVIPCCADFDHFPLGAPMRGGARERLGLPRDAKVIAYLGSVGTWYMLDEMLEFFAVYAAQVPSAWFLLVTGDDERIIRRSATRLGIDHSRIIVRSASRNEVPQLLAAADAGISFIKPVFSKIGSSPTKMAEMLAMGLPIVANPGVGDVEPLLEEMGSGVIVRSFDRAGYQAAVADLEALTISPEDIRSRARSILDLGRAIECYDAIYEAAGSRKADASS